MEHDGTELALEKEILTEQACIVPPPHSVSVVFKPDKIDQCGNNQASTQITLTPITLKSSTQGSHASDDIKVTLENESVWSRFHSLGTEMILTKQGRRMFPCCRFRLSGLDLQRRYSLVMDIMPLDDSIHRWNGKTWEPVTVDEPHEQGQICVHPESPALGQQWMDSPVSFYKVKLTSDSTDQEGCVLLRPMHRYQPRLHVVPVDSDSEGIIALDKPNVKIFTFPQTEFYAVTSYQNPKITQLKIDCNPFAMAFREDNQSIRLLQDKLRLSSSVGTHFRSPLLSLARNLSGKRKEVAVKNTTSACMQDNRITSLYPGSVSFKEGEGIFTKIRNANLDCPNNVAFCKDSTDCSENDRGTEAVVNKCQAERVLDEHVAPLDFEPSVRVSLEEPLPSTDEPDPPENQESSEVSEDAVISQLSCTNSESPAKSSMASQSPQTPGEIKSDAVSLPRPPFLNGSQAQECEAGHLFRCRRSCRVRKAKAKCWSNVKYAKSPPADVPLNVPLQPDLEDVEGMLFVSFVAKEALNTHGENIKESETSLPPSSPTHNESDNHEAEDASLSIEERIAKLEKVLLLHLKQQKHRQVIHPLLQDVGMKLSLLDPKLPIDLQYLGVHFAFPPSIHEGLDKMNPVSLSSSPDAAGYFVSRTGKTNDPTKIKGWRDKFKSNTVPSALEGLKNSSAFCSEMLDAYLENEAQQISDRVDVFSKCSASPVSYQLPSKSSSYVVTLDSLLKTRSVSSNKVYSKPKDKILPKSPLKRTTRAAVRLSSAGLQDGFTGNQEKGRNLANSSQAHQHAVSTVKSRKSVSFVSRPGMKKQPGKSQLSWNSNAGIVRCSMIPRKLRNLMMLQEMEEEVVFNGKLRTHITTERAKFALTSLLSFKKPDTRPKFCIRDKDENTCPEDFCRLGCMCDSLDREIRGPTHCRRVECMFDCHCFKHKVLLLHPPKETASVQGRRRSLLAFSIADPERQTRPPPAPSITTLWERTKGEHDPEPLFIPISSTPVSRLRTRLLHSTSQVREEDKDPVYLYFESMMTCARVREYNSNPPPQMHMFPVNKEGTEPEQLNKTAEVHETGSCQKIPETNSTETRIKPGDPKPTKLLEILSECNWEPHRSMVLTALFRRMKGSCLSEPFCFGLYKIKPLSTTFKEGDKSSTITYKVCISLADETERTTDLEPPVKKTTRNQSSKGFKNKVLKKNETQARKATADTDYLLKCRGLLEMQQKPLYKRLLRALPFPNHSACLGYLKADKKKPGSLAQGLIKVNGKTYNQAKLLLGQLGALHPVNRFAAFVTGRLLPVRRDQRKIEDSITKAFRPIAPLGLSFVIREANLVSLDPLASAPEPNSISKNTRSKTSLLNNLSNLVGRPPGTTPIVPDCSKFVLVPVMPSNSAAAPSTETVGSSTLPPGQQVVLQPASGMPGSNFLCQYNGQMIQLKPISPGPLQSQPSAVCEGIPSQVMQTAYNTCLPKDTVTLPVPLNSTPVTNMEPKPFAVLAPRVLSLSAKSGMNIANGMPAFNLQSSFPGKTGTFSFRICPPTGEGKPVGSEHGDKPPEPSVDNNSVLMLPGGFTLIKLIQPAVPANVTSSAADSAKIPENNESMDKSIGQSCTPSLEQNCQLSEKTTNPLCPETSKCNPGQGASAGLSNSSSDFTSEGVIKDEPVEHFSESVNTVTPGKYNWVPEGAEMVHTSDISELEPKDMDDWPPKGAERILWKDSAGDEENDSLNEELNKSLDIAAGSPVAEEASESKTIPTGIIKDEDGLPPEDACSKSSHGNEQKHHLKPSMANNDQAKVCAANSNTTNNTKQKTSFSSLIKKANNKPKRISFSSRNARKQAGIQESCPPVLIKNEPTDMNMAGNEPGIKNQGLLPENNTLHISKIETYNRQTGKNTLPDHFNWEQRLGDSRDSLKADAFSVNDDVSKQHKGSENIIPPVSKEAPSMNQTVTEFSSDPSNHGLASENSSQILTHKAFYNNPAKPNTTPFPHNMHKSSPELSEGLDNLSDNYTKTSKVVKPDLKEEKDKVEDRNKQLDEEIFVDVMTLSEYVDPSDEDSSSDDGEGDSSSDEEFSSNDSSIDNETRSDTMDLSTEDDVDIESFEDDEGMRIINMRKNQIRREKYAKITAKLKKKIKNLTHFISAAEEPTLHEFEKRLSHNEKERFRRDELRQAFVSLKKALNIEEQVKICNHDILNQARIMIRALEDRSHCLEKKKKALIQRRCAYLNKIVELSGKTKNKDKGCFKENYELQKSQNSLQTPIPGPIVNPRRLDSDGNRLPPRLGRWKAPNYIRKRSKKALKQPSVATTVAVGESLDSSLSPDTPDNHTVSGPLTSVKTEELVRKLIAQNPTGLPPICETPQQNCFSAEPKPTEKRSLPKIVLQSFGKTDAVRLTRDTRTSLPSSSDVSNSAELLMGGNLDLQNQKKGTEKCEATRVSSELEKTLLSEHLNKESPALSSTVTESDVQNNTLSELEKDEQASAPVVKVRKKRGKSDVVIDPTSIPVLRPRQLRQRSPAANRGTTRGNSANKRRRII